MVCIYMLQQSAVCNALFSLPVKVSFEKFRTLPSSCLVDECDGDNESEEDVKESECRRACGELIKMKRLLKINSSEVPCCSV